MKVFYNKYRILSGYNVCNKIIDFFKEEKIPLTNEQERILKRYWGEDIGMHGNLNLPFQAYEWDKQKPAKNTVLWRFTLPFLFIYVILLGYIIKPLKWLITGNYHWPHTSKIEDFTKKWYYSVFNE